MARASGSAATDLLLKEIKAGGKTAFLALEALREADKSAYDALPVQKRVDTYIDTLTNNVFYNAWGVPGYHLTDTARALIGLGAAAVPPLKALLDDEREAPLSGSQDATTSKMYGNRVCDYAWLFICEIKGWRCQYGREPAERDEAREMTKRDLQDKGSSKRRGD
jgi:hypothetical protein